MTKLDNAPLYLNRIHPPIDILIETEFQSGLFRALDERFRLQRINRTIDGTPATAVISTGLDEDDLAQRTNDEPVGIRHFAHLVEEIDPSLRVVIQQTNGEGEPTYLFDGFPQRTAIRWDANSQTFSVNLIETGAEALQADHHRRVIGRYLLAMPLEIWSAGSEDRGQVIQIPAMPCHFNAGGKPNRTPEHYPVRVPDGTGTWDVHFFTEDAAPEAEYWTYAQALRYLLYWYAAKRGSIPISVADFMTDTNDLIDGTFNSADKNSFRRRLTQRVKDMRVDSVSIWDGIALAVRDAGLHFELALRSTASSDATQPWSPEPYIRVFATLESGEEDYELAMGRPQAYDIPRRAPFTALAESADVQSAPTIQDLARANAAQQATITHDHRLMNRIAYLGGIKRYECTLPLLPGWLPFVPPYDAYPDLLDVPLVHVLDNVPQLDEEAIAAAADYWAALIPNVRDKLSGRPEDNQFHRLHPRFNAVAAVGRKWIFPTDWRYASPTADQAESPYWRNGLPDGMDYEPFLSDNLTNKLADPVYGGGIADAALASWIARRRPFLAPISRFQNSAGIPPLVQYKVGGDPFSPDDWYDLSSGGYDVDPHDSSIWISAGTPADIDVPGDSMRWHTLTQNWYYWLITQQLYLRVTCTIEGDDRIFSDQTPVNYLQRRRGGVRDMGERFRYQDRRTGNSIFATEPEEDPEFDSIKDLSDDGESGALVDYAKDNAKIEARQIISGDVELPWIDYTWRLGDSITGVAGLGLVFHDSPEVVAVQWVIDGRSGYRTQYQLSDLRSDPTGEYDVESGE